MLFNLTDNNRGLDYNVTTFKEIQTITQQKKPFSKKRMAFFNVVRGSSYSILIQPSFIEIFAPFLTFTQPQAVLISTSEALV